MWSDIVMHNYRKVQWKGWIWLNQFGDLNENIQGGRKEGRREGMEKENGGETKEGKRSLKNEKGKWIIWYVFNMSGIESESESKKTDEWRRGRKCKDNVSLLESLHSKFMSVAFLNWNRITTIMNSLVKKRW